MLSISLTVIMANKARQPHHKIATVTAPVDGLLPTDQPSRPAPLNRQILINDLVQVRIGFLHELLVAGEIRRIVQVTLNPIRNALIKSIKWGVRGKTSDGC